MAKWAVDLLHSEVHFKIKHLVISTVTGSFKKFDGSFESPEGDFSDAKAHFTIDTASVDTNSGERDQHLRSDDFFNCEKYPQMKFESTSISKKTDDEYILQGQITIRDITKSIELDVDYGGQTIDLYAQTKAGFDVTGIINRQDFGLKWSAVTDSGGLVVSNDVRLSISVQFVKQAG